MCSIGRIKSGFGKSYEVKGDQARWDIYVSLAEQFHIVKRNQLKSPLIKQWRSCIINKSKLPFPNSYSYNLDSVLTILRKQRR